MSTLVANVVRVSCVEGLKRVTAIDVDSGRNLEHRYATGLST